MDKNKVAIPDQKTTPEKKAIPPTREDIELAVIDLQLAEQDMNMAVEPDFIDAAIHRYSASLSRYQALVKLMKGSGADDDKSVSNS